MATSTCRPTTAPQATNVSPVPFIDSVRRQLVAAGAELHISFRYLEIILRTLGSKAAAVRFSVQSTREPLTYQNVILADLLAVPIDVAECAECINKFQDNPHALEILYYCVANNVALRRSKLDETKLELEMQESREIQLGVESLQRQLSVVAEGRVAEIDLDPKLMGDPLTTEQVRIELFRALSNFLLRHLFWRYTGGEKPKKLLRSKDRGSLIYFIPETPRRVNFSVRFGPSDAKSTPMDSTKQHVFRTPRDGVLHDVVNGYGYGARTDGLTTAVAIRLADLALLDAQSACHECKGSGDDAVEFLPLVSTFLALPELLRLRAFVSRRGLPQLFGSMSVAAGRFGDAAETTASVLNTFRTALGIRSARVVYFNFHRKAPASGAAGEKAVSVGVELIAVGPKAIPDIYRQLETLCDAATFNMPRQSQVPVPYVVEHPSQPLRLSPSTIEEHLAAFGIATTRSWIADPTEKLMSEPRGRNLSRILRQEGLDAAALTFVGAERHSNGTAAEPGNPAAESQQPLSQEYAFVLPVPDDLLCLCHNVLLRAAVGYVPADLLRMTLTVTAADWVAALMQPVLPCSELRGEAPREEGGLLSTSDKADIFLALREVLLRSIEYHSAAEDVERAEAVAKTVNQATATDRPRSARSASASTAAAPSAAVPPITAQKRRQAEARSPTPQSHRTSTPETKKGHAGAVSTPDLTALPSLSEYPTVMSAAFGVDDEVGDTPRRPFFGSLDGADEEGPLDDLFDRCDVWLALARNAVLGRRNLGISNDAVALAALQLLLTAAFGFVNHGTGEYPFRASLAADDELQRSVRQWTTELLAKERAVCSRLASRQELHNQTNTLLQNALAAFAAISKP